MNYVVGLLERSPILKQLIVRKTSEEVELSTGITIEVRTASFRSLRGFTSIAVVATRLRSGTRTRVPTPIPRYWRRFSRRLQPLAGR